MQDKIMNNELSKVLGGGSEAALTSDLTRQAQFVISGGLSPAGDAGTAAGMNSFTDALAQNTSQLSLVQTTLQGQLDSLVANTQAVTDNTTNKSVGSAAASVAGGVASSLLGGGILGPIVSGLMSLFGDHNDSQTPAPLTKYVLPAKVDYQGGTQGGNIASVDYDQSGKPRSTAAAAQGQQITVNVNAMDSRSFLDHSSDIANAVRRAMLESNSLNDVIGEM